MSKFTLEVCADSVESVLAAEKGGADRIELCGNVVIGGTTPSESLFREIRRYSDIKIHALIRPRFGDFCYTEYEFPGTGCSGSCDRYAKTGWLPGCGASGTAYGGSEGDVCNFTQGF